MVNKKVEDSHEKYRLLLENLPEAIVYLEIIMDYEGNYTDYIFLDINQGFEKLTGLTKKNIMGKKAVEVYPEIEESNSKWLDIFGKVVLTGESCLFEEYFEAHACWYQVSVFPESGNNIFVIFYDITDRKEKEERTKEINCLLGLTNLFKNESFNLEQILKKTVTLLPPSFQDPENIYVRLIYKEHEFKTYNYKESSWKLISKIKVDGVQEGRIEVSYLMDPTPARDPFLKEERMMLDLISEQLSSAIQKRQGEKRLKAKKEELEKLLDFQQGILDATIIWVNTVDAQGNITFWNKAAEEISGYSEEEVFGHAKIWDWLYPDHDYREKILAKVQKIIQKGEVVESIETQIRRKDGMYRTISWYSNNFNRDSITGGSIAFGADVTEHREIETNLKEQEDKLESIYQYAPLIMMLLDENKKIKKINDYALSIIDKPAKELIGLHVAEVLRCLLTHGNTLGQKVESYCDHCSLCSMIEDVFINKKKGQQVELSIPLIIEDTRKEFYFIASSTKLSKGEEPLVLLILQDITDRKLAEEQLKTSYDKMWALSKRVLQGQEEDRSRLARELHDEVGQALTAVKLDLQMLGDELFKLEGPFDKKLSQSIEMVDSTLKLVRKHSGLLRPPALDDMGLITAVKEMARGFGNRTKINTNVTSNGFVSRLSKDLETALFRCIQEALTNVARHSKAQNVTIDLKYEPQKVSVLIQDDGQGFRLEKAETSTDHIGLVGMQERVEHLQGDIIIESYPGEGTNIYITVPL